MYSPLAGKHAFWTKSEWLNVTFAFIVFPDLHTEQVWFYSKEYQSSGFVGALVSQNLLRLWQAVYSGYWENCRNLYNHFCKIKRKSGLICKEEMRLKLWETHTTCLLCIIIFMWSTYFSFTFFSLDHKAKVSCIQEKYVRKGKIQMKLNLNFTSKENLIGFIHFL